MDRSFGCGSGITCGGVNGGTAKGAAMMTATHGWVGSSDCLTREHRGGSYSLWDHGGVWLLTTLVSPGERDVLFASRRKALVKRLAEAYFDGGVPPLRWRLSLHGLDLG